MKTSEKTSGVCSWSLSSPEILREPQSETYSTTIYTPPPPAKRLGTRRRGRGPRREKVQVRAPSDGGPQTRRGVKTVMDGRERTGELGRQMIKALCKAAEQREKKRVGELEDKSRLQSGLKGQEVRRTERQQHTLFLQLAG